MTVSVEPDLIKILDDLRGEVPRSRQVEHVLRNYVENEMKLKLKGLQGSNVYQAQDHPATSTLDPEVSKSDDT